MITDIKITTEQKMQKSLEALKADLGKVRTGRAHTGLLDHVMVEYYGTPTLVTQVANITLIDARTIGVQPWEKNMVGPVERAIRDSDLGLNPATNGDLIKVVKSEGEAAKVAVRNIRRDANHSLKEAFKNKEIAEDVERRLQDEVQKLTDRFVAEIDKALAAKEADLMAV